MKYDPNVFRFACKRYLKALEKKKLGQITYRVQEMFMI
jgi:hypothetical protein